MHVVFRRANIHKFSYAFFWVKIPRMLKCSTLKPPYIQDIFGVGQSKRQNLIIGLSNQPSYSTRGSHHIEAGMLMLHGSEAETPVSWLLA